MKDEQIDRLFDALRNEPPSIQSNEVIEWLDHTPKAPFNRNWKSGIKLKTLLFGIFCFIAALFALLSIESNSHQTPSLPHTPNKAKERVGNGQDGSVNVIHTSTRRTREERPQTDVFNIPSDTLNFEPTTVPYSDDLPFAENKMEHLNDDNYWNINPVDLSQHVEIRDDLFILDSLKSYGRLTRFTMDEPDCYLQIYKDYAVISYRFRNRTYFSAVDNSP